jgi:NDP-sugar pyrophosphorylase family protein
MEGVHENILSSTTPEDEVMEPGTKPLFWQQGNSLQAVGWFHPGKYAQLTAFATKTGPAVQVDLPKNALRALVFPGGFLRHEVFGTTIRLWPGQNGKGNLGQKTAFTVISAPPSAAIPNSTILAPTTQAQQPIVQAFIPAGGKATRLQPLTLELPKPAMPIGKDETLISRIVRQLHAVGIRQFVVNTWDKPTAVEQALRPFDNKLGRFLFERDSEARGDFGAVVHLLRHPKPGGIDPRQPLLVIQGDAYLDNVNLQQLLDLHQKKNAALTLLASPVAEEDVHHFGIVETDLSGDDGQSGHIQRFLEKPQPSETSSRLANTAIYVFSPQALKKIPDIAQALGNPKKLNLGSDIMPKLIAAIQQGELKNASGEAQVAWAQRLQGTWMDVGRPEAYFRVFSRQHPHEPISWPGVPKLPQGLQARGNVVLMPAEAAAFNKTA